MGLEPRVFVLPRAKLQVLATAFSEKQEMANSYYLGGREPEWFLEMGSWSVKGIAAKDLLSDLGQVTEPRFPRM